MSQKGKAFSKLNPLKYPTSKVKRAQTPPEFAAHGRYKPYLQSEFGGRCVYCRRSDYNQSPASFHVEHYKPQKRFPELSTSYTNLFYSCDTCNRKKWHYWHEEPAKRILNPCDHVMSHHLHFDKEEICFSTAQGELFVDILGVNDPKSIAFRQYEYDLLLLLIEGIIDMKDGRRVKDDSWIERSVEWIVKMTGTEAERVGRLLRIWGRVG